MRPLLFTPSGVNAPAGMSTANEPVMTHRSPRFAQLLHDVRHLVVRCLDGEDDHEAVMLAASGTGAVEAMLGAVDGPVLVLVNGRYSWNMAGIAEAVGHEVRILQTAPFAGIDPTAVEQA